VLHGIVVSRGGLEEVMVADVHDSEMISNKADAIGPRGKGVTADFERDLGEEIALVFLLHGAGVAGGIDEDGQRVTVFREADCGGVAELGVGGFTGEVNGVGEKLRGFGRVEDGALRGRGERQESESGDDERVRAEGAEKIHTWVSWVRE
jgi:hypothetical protein